MPFWLRCVLTYRLFAFRVFVFSSPSIFLEVADNKHFIEVAIIFVLERGKLSVRAHVFLIFWDERDFSSSGFSIMCVSASDEICAQTSLAFRLSATVRAVNADHPNSEGFADYAFVTGSIYAQRSYYHITLVGLKISCGCLLRTKCLSAFSFLLKNNDVVLCSHAWLSNWLLCRSVQQLSYNIGKRRGL